MNSFTLAVIGNASFVIGVAAAAAALILASTQTVCFRREHDERKK